MGKFNVGDRVYEINKPELIMIVKHIPTHSVRVNIPVKSSPFIGIYNSERQEQETGKVICEWKNSLHNLENKQFSEDRLNKVEE